ncbi:hypothetical protein [Chlamydia suis]|uniref:hypothetical protein n=1 Tax=Chlamydia suis TaxID=83559 RepID=UPI0009B16586|nr:hypothetical protein [Chlamydia suis]
MFFSKKKAARTGLLVLSNKLGLSPENSEYRSQGRLRFQSETTHNDPIPPPRPAKNKDLLLVSPLTPKQLLAIQEIWSWLSHNSSFL